MSEDGEKTRHRPANFDGPGVGAGGSDSEKTPSADELRARLEDSFMVDSSGRALLWMKLDQCCKAGDLPEEWAKAEVSAVSDKLRWGERRIAELEAELKVWRHE